MSASKVPDLVGLILAGGESRRMQSDKGALEFRGQTLVERCLNLLQPVCASTYVSVRASQAESDPYRNLPLIIDDGSVRGPAAGLLAAWSEVPDAALLVLAVDMPLVTSETLQYLVSRRNPSASATAYRHEDGTIEPLLAIWEPGIRPKLLEAGPAPSLKRVLEQSTVELLEPPRPAELASANTPEAFERARRALPEAQKPNFHRKSPI